MNIESFALPAVVLVATTSLLLLVSPDWRISIAALAMQYVGVFILVGLDWPVGMATAKLVAGWIAGAVLGMAVIGLPRPQSEEGLPIDQEPQPSKPKRSNIIKGFPYPDFPSSRLFRLFAAILVVLAIISLAPELEKWVPLIELVQAWGGLILIGMGMLQLGFTSQPLRTTVALLTLLSGFEILYSVVETSALVAGLLAGVTLVLALAGAYLLQAPIMEAE